MTAYSKRAKRKARKASPFDLDPIPPREKNGRAHRPREQRDPSIESLKARCRQMGKTITTANLREVRQPWWGCSAGRVIAEATMPDTDRAHLWDAIQHMRKVITAFDASIGAPKRHAVCLRLLAPSEAMHADATTPAVDTRTDADRARQATAALMQLEGWLGYTDKAAAGIAKRVVWDDAHCTSHAALLAALRCVSDGIRGKRLTFRPGA